MCASLLALALAALAAAPAAAQPQELSLDEAREQLSALQQELAETQSEQRLPELRGQALLLQARLRDASSGIAPQLEQSEAQIARLGPAPEDAPEPGDVAAQRRELESARAELDGQTPAHE